MRYFLVLFMLLSGIAYADWMQVSLAYQNKDYATAKAGFEVLIPVGNAKAAYNLGVMAYLGQGQSADAVTATAYFRLAEQLNYVDENNVLAQLTARLNAEQLQQVAELYQLLQQAVLVKNKYDRENTSPDLIDTHPKRLKNIYPMYPVKAAQQGMFGYNMGVFLVNERGEVKVIDILDGYPEGVFDYSSVAAIKGWQYEATGKKHILSTRLDYSLNGNMDMTALEKLFYQDDLWQKAVSEYPFQQTRIGTLLELLRIYSRNILEENKTLAASPEQPDLSVFRAENLPEAVFEGFYGWVRVKVAADGSITEELEAEFDESNTLKTLLGLKLQGAITTEIYQLSRYPGSVISKIYVQPVLEIPEILTSYYWWDLAARNGERQAQKIMAWYHSDWRAYLASQQDAEMMAWFGAEKIISGEYEQGMALLDEAIALGYKPANELKKLLKQ